MQNNPPPNSSGQGDAATPPLGTGSSREGAHDHILNSAIEIFARKGYEGAALREIGLRAGVNHAMIKYYFGNKEQLWRAAVSFLFERQLRELSPRAIFEASGGDPQLCLRLFCEQLIRYWARYPEHARLVMMASMTPGPRLDWIIEQTRRNHSVFRAVFPPGPDPEQPGDPTSVALLYLIVGACQSVFTLEHEIKGLYGIDVSDPAFIDQFVNLATGLLAPSAPSEKGEIEQTEGREKGAKGKKDDAAGTNSHSTGSFKPMLQSRRTAAGLELRILIPDSEL